MGYKDIPIPEGKDPKDFTYQERRAEIFKFIIAAGHPQNVSQTELGKRYGKSQVQIHKDMKHIRQEILDSLGTDAGYITKTVLNKAIKDLSKSADSKDKYNAAVLALRWMEWVEPKAATKIEQTHKGLLDDIVRDIGLSKKDVKK